MGNNAQPSRNALNKGSLCLVKVFGRDIYTNNQSKNFPVSFWKDIRNQVVANMYKKRLAGNKKFKFKNGLNRDDRRELFEMIDRAITKQQSERFNKLKRKTKASLLNGSVRALLHCNSALSNFAKELIAIQAEANVLYAKL